MSGGRRLPATRVVVAATFFAISSMAVLTGQARGEDSVSDLRARMDDIQAQLDATTAHLEELRTKQDNVRSRIREIQARMGTLSKKEARLKSVAVARADELYRSGNAMMFEALLGSDDFTEVMDRAQFLSQMSIDDSSVFAQLARSQSELKQLQTDLTDQQSELGSATDAIASESERLQDQFESVSDEYEDLRKQLLAQSSAPSTSAPAAAAPVQVHVSGDMTCPVAGPVSFTDTWGAPRSGHTHQGVDMMAAYGTPIVAITSGNITYAAYDGSGGNMIFLSGDDGNAYWYMHNQQNLVTGGHVSVGQQIATVGDTGNAVGTPHLHFEFHPGGGAAINPTPLVASLC